jgi:hypothetical protein
MERIIRKGNAKKDMSKKKIITPVFINTAQIRVKRSLRQRIKSAAALRPNTTMEEMSNEVIEAGLKAIGIK